MPSPKLFPQQRLQGVSVLLSADIPAPDLRGDYERVPDAPLRIEEAVLSVSRAVFIEAGTLVLSAHPGFSPLVARAAAHYHLPATAEASGPTAGDQIGGARWANPSLVMYQSEVWKERWMEASQRLSRRPLVRFEWTRAARGESVAVATGNLSQVPKSMAIMRRAMIEDTSPVALIVAGGTEGAQEEVELFARLCPDRPIFALTTTGGLAALLPQRQQYVGRLRVLDPKAEELVARFWAGQESSVEPSGQEDRRSYVPYAFVAQQIVAQIAEGLG